MRKLSSTHKTETADEQSPFKVFRAYNDGLHYAFEVNLEDDFL